MKNKKAKKIKTIAIVFLVVIIIIHVALFTGINYQLLDIRQRIMLIVIYVLIIALGLYVLRRQLILYGLGNNIPKEKRSELVVEETVSQVISNYSYSLYFNGDNRHDDVLGRILEDVFFQRSIPFYSKELVNIMWELKGNDDIIIRNGTSIKKIDDISSLLDGYKTIMIKLNRKKTHIEFVRDGIVKRTLSVIGRKILINTNKREGEALKTLIREYGFLIE